MILLADTVGDGAVTKEVTEATSEAVQEVGKFAEYVNDNIPELIGFGVRVLLALVVFFIGTKIIKLLRKIVRRSLQKSTVDKGVEQFVDSMLKFVLYIILIFSIGSNFGIDTTSVAALLASGGVAIGLALQGALSNFAGGVLILILKPFVVGDYIIEDTNKCEGTVKEIFIKQPQSLRRLLGEEEETLPDTGHHIQISYLVKDMKDGELFSTMTSELQYVFPIVNGLIQDYQGDQMGIFVINIDDEHLGVVTDYLNQKGIKWRELSGEQGEMEVNE